MGFVRPGKGLANPQRCAAAVYRHVVRHGAPQILGLNSFPETEDDPFLFEFEDTELDSARPCVGQAFERSRALLRQYERSEEF